MSIRRAVRTGQPQGAVPVDWGNPITRGLALAYASSIDAIMGQASFTKSWSTYGTPPPNGALAGYTGRVFSGVGSQYTTNHPVIPDGTPFTVLMLAFSSGNNVNPSFVCCDPNPPRHFQLRNDGFIAFNTAGSPFIVTPGSSVVLPAGATRVVVGRVTAGGEVSVWSAGAKVSSTTLTGTIAGNGDSTSAYEFGGRNTGSYVSGIIPLFCQWSRALTDAEIASISANPWQLFAPIQQPLWVPVAASGGSVSLLIQNVAQGHLAGNLNLSSAVSLTVQAAMQAHAADNVVLSASGAVSLSIAASAHAHAASAPVPSTAAVLAVAGAIHSQVADQLLLGTGASLVVSQATHGHLAGGATLNTAAWLAVAHALHMQLANQVGITGGIVVVQGGLAVLIRRRRR